MVWRAAATCVSGAILLLQLARFLDSCARQPERVLAAGVLAAILGTAAFGAVTLSTAVVVAAADFMSGAA